MNQHLQLIGAADVVIETFQYLCEKGLCVYLPSLKTYCELAPSAATTSLARILSPFSNDRTGQGWSWDAGVTFVTDPGQRKSREPSSI